MERETRLMRSVMAATIAAAFVVAGGVGMAGAQERSATSALLGGSVFPFARSFPGKASPRCQRMADRMRAQRDDNVLNPIDFQRLRSVGCQDVRPYD